VKTTNVSYNTLPLRNTNPNRQFYFNVLFLFTVIFSSSTPVSGNSHGTNQLKCAMETREHIAEG